MFQGDQDGDIAIEIDILVMGERDPPYVFAWATSVGPPQETFPKGDLSAYRQKFDSGIGDELREYLGKKTTDPLDSYEYRSIVLAAMMMHVGAQIKQEHIQRLREIVPKILSREGFQWPICDDGFRGPGKRQFLAALDYYQSGTPRSFKQPSCHACGKVDADIGRPLLRCGGCTIAHAWFCDKVCYIRILR